MPPGNPQQRHTQQPIEAATEISEKINTKAETPQEMFETFLTGMLEKVLRREVGPQQAIHELHSFWQSLSLEFRNELSSATPGNVVDAGSRLMTAANMLGNEMNALIAEHNNSKGF